MDRPDYSFDFIIFNSTFVKHLTLGDGIKTSGSGVSSDGYFGENLLVPGISGSQRIHQFYMRHAFLIILLNFVICWSMLYS